MKQSELKILLDQKYDQFNTVDFIRDDPIQIPHLFDCKEDIEIAGFLTALIAWGRRDIIIRSALKLVDAMERQPYAFVVEGDESDWEVLAGFVHRTFKGEDCLALLRALKELYLEHGGLEGAFSDFSTEDEDVFQSILSARHKLTAHPDFPSRTHKHLANPSRGSSAKRINMFLRWMVRSDKRGVDFGLWTQIRPDQLICPLDVHTGNVARKLGILDRKQNDWKAAKILTDFLKKLHPEDPVRYDFSLFGLGVYDGF